MADHTELPPVLTLWRPWAELLLTDKDVENRGWRTTYRGPLLIHAGATWDDEAMPFACAVSECRGFDWHEAAHPTGIVGVVELTDCTCGPMARCRCGVWAAAGQFHWRRDNPRGFSEPIPCRGRQGLWRVPDDVAPKVRQALEAVAAGG